MLDSHEQYPFHEISIGRSRKVKYLHALFVCAGLLIPFVPIISSMVDFAIEIKDSSTNEVSFLSGGLGFGIYSFHPILCALEKIEKLCSTPTFFLLI